MQTITTILTPELKEEVINLMLSGRMEPDDIARKYGLNLNTLRSWRQRKLREIKELAKRSARSASKQVHQDAKTIDTLSACNLIPRNHSLALMQNASENVERMRDDSIAQQISILSPLKGKLSKTLQESHELISQSIQGIAKLLKTSEDIGEHKTAVQAAGIAIKELSELHCLPRGALNLHKLLEPERGPAQHLHLHQSGIRRAKPSAVKAAIIDITPEQSTAACRTAAELSSNQRRLIEDS